MPVTIRLARGGAKNKPHYRLVVADSRFAATGRFIENVGRYDPMLDKKSENRFVFDETRVKYWLSVGAQPSSRVHILLSKEGLLEKKSLTEQTKQHLPKKGTLEKQKAKEEKQKAATPQEEPSAEPSKEEAKQEAKQEAKEETKTETPKEEAKAEPKQEVKEEAPKEETKQEVKAEESTQEAKSAPAEAPKKEASAEAPQKEEPPKPEAQS